MGNRLLIVSNRLPISARPEEGGVRLTPADGGLATGLRPWHARSGGQWIGWPGDVAHFTPQQIVDLDRQLAEHRVVPVYLSRDQIDRFYHGFSNRVLWPLFHYQLDRVPVDATDWAAYRHVNEVFADVVAREYRDGDVIWVHDYHLMLLPGCSRARYRNARVGFFLHIPFPSFEVFRLLPGERQILDGLLGADLIGFHTYEYMRHFLHRVLRMLAASSRTWTAIRVEDAEVRVGAFPMGIDADEFASAAGDPESSPNRKRRS